MPQNNLNYCLVLAGGGAKGVYHIGAWQALQEMGVKVDAFIGNSIGAIISGFLAQGESKKLVDISSQIGLDFILNVPKELLKDGDFNLDDVKWSGFKKFYKNTISKKGLDTSPLRNLLSTNLDETKIRNSGNDLGVVTYNVSDWKPKEVFVEDMEEGHLIDYLMASSAVPGFEQPEIAGKKYIDGAVFDNIPYTMAQKRGYKRIIVIDISALGKKRKLDIQGGQIIYIKNSINMGGLLDFDKVFLEKFTKLGYLDTLRTFDRLRGYNYFIVPNEEMEEHFVTFISGPEYQLKFLNFAEYILGEQSMTLPLALKKIFPENARFEKHWLTVFSDCAATILSIERIEKWDYQNLFVEFKKQLEIVHQKVDELAKSDLKHIESIVQDRLKGKKIFESSYYYYLLVDRLIPGKAKKILKKGLVTIYPRLAAGHFFLAQMQKFWKT